MNNCQARVLLLLSYISLSQASDSVNVTTVPADGGTGTEVYILGNNGEPEDLYPLPECAGDCDDDEDCGPGLVCFQRDANEPVPGCLGGEEFEARTDFCIKGNPSFSVGSDGLLNPGLVITATIPPISFPAKPTEAPSVAPSQSLSPSGSPTTSAPPTISAAPSTSPTESKRFFQVRLHWTEKSCWQEDCKRDPGWCMQCEGYRCNVGDELWVEPCRQDLPEQQLFEWVPIPQNLFASSSLRSRSSSTLEWGLLQSSWDHTEEFSKRLCFERVGSRYYKLQYCDMNEYRQWFRGFDFEKPFELNAPPSNQPRITSTDDSCVTMPHHPRLFEHLYHTSCREAREHTSSLWKVVYGTKDKAAESEFDPEKYYRLGDRRTDPRCTDSTKCGMCQGHCESSSQCEGSLRCFRRGSSNPTETPPGCYGKGVPQMNYCYAEPGN